MIHFPFFVQIPKTVPWRLVLCPNDKPTAEDLQLIALQREKTPLFSPVGAAVEQQSNGMLKVALTPQITQKMKSGRWSAVMQYYKGDKWVNSSVSLDVVFITDDTKKTDPTGIIGAFCNGMESPEMPFLKKRY